MADLWLPQQVKDTQAAYRAEALRQLQVFREWNPILQRIDKRLSLVFAPPHVNHPALKPGYWHVLCDKGENIAPDILIHQTEGGDPLPPNSLLLENIRKWDMSSNRSMYEQRKVRERAEKERQARLEQEKNDRIEETLDRFRHKYVTKISVPRGI